MLSYIKNSLQIENQHSRQLTHPELTVYSFCANFLIAGDIFYIGSIQNVYFLPKWYSPFQLLHYLGPAYINMEAEGRAPVNTGATEKDAEPMGLGQEGRQEAEASTGQFKTLC